MKLILLLLAILSFTASAKYKILDSTIAVGDQIKPEAGAAFVVQSTTQSSLPCPKMTEVQRDALTPKAVGGCVYNLTSVATEFWNGSSWLKAGSSAVISEWLTGTAYGIGSFVYTTPDFKLWLANTAHTAGATFAGDIANWDEASNDIDTIASSTDNAISRWDGTTGALIQDSGVLIDDSDNITGVVNFTATGNLSGVNLTATGVTTLDTAFTGIPYLTAGVVSATGILVDGSDNMTGVVDITATGDITGNNLSGTNTGDQIALTVPFTPTVNVLATNLQASTKEVGDKVSFMDSTSLIGPCALTINGGDAAKYDIPACTLQFIDNYTDPSNPTKTILSFAGSTANIVANLAAQDATFISMNAAGSILETVDIPSPVQLRDYVLLGGLTHPSRVDILSANVFTATVSDQIASTLFDLGSTLGPLNRSGNIITGNLTNTLKLDKSVGATFEIGFNTGSSAKSPNVSDDLATTAATYFYSFRDGAGGFTISIEDTIVPGLFDDNSVGGVTGPVDVLLSNKWQMFKIYHILPTNILVVEAGQVSYASYDEALANKEAQTSINPAVAALKFRGWYVVKGNATDLNDAAEAVFIDAGVLGQTTAGGSHGTSTTSLQGAYNNSTAPQIVVDATRGSLQVADASTPIAAPLFEVLDNAALVNYFTVAAANVSTINDILMTGTGQIDIASGTTAQRSGSPNAGMFRHNSDTSKFEGYTNGAWGEIGGGGAVGINYILNPDAEINIDGYIEYTDVAGLNPVDGTGGASSGYLTRNITTPLRGTGDFKYAKPASLKQGIGFSYDFTIDVADKAQKLTASFNYDASHAGYADGDIRLSVYDVTNSQLIRVNGEDLKGGKGKHYFQFQTASDSVNYRLIFHVSSVSALAYDLYFDTVAVGPTTLARGSTIIGRKSFTPTGSWSTNTTYTGFKWRVGQHAFYDIKVSLSGAPNTATLTIDVPDGAIDTSVLDATANSQGIGDVTILDSGSNRFVGRANYATSTTVRASFLVDTGTTREDDSPITQASPMTFASGDSVHIMFSVPIQGWSSDSAMSEDLGGSEIVVMGVGNSAAPITAATERIDFTVVEDTTSSWSQVDGNGKDTFTAPETGYYLIEGSTRSGGFVGQSVNTYIDNSESKRIGFDTSTASTLILPISGVEYLTRGQTLDFRFGGTATLSNTGRDHWIHIQKLASPQTILETETVAARYTSNSGSNSIADNLDTIVNFENLDYDTHGFCTIGVSFRCTAPSTGKYRVSSELFWTNTTNLLTTYVNLYKNGVLKSIGDHSITVRGVSISDTIDLNKGEYIDIRAYQDDSGGSARTLLNDSERNYFSIERVK